MVILPGPPWCCLSDSGVFETLVTLMPPRFYLPDFQLYLKSRMLLSLGSFMSVMFVIAIEMPLDYSDQEFSQKTWKQSLYETI